MSVPNDVRQSTRRGLEQLATWAVGCEWTAVPVAARRRTVLIVADDLAAMVAGSSDPQARAVQSGFLEVLGPPEATVFGPGGRRAGRAVAAAANGAAADWAELDEGYRPRTCHGGLYVLPAALAEAEASGASAADLLRATVVGYEVVTRVARAFDLPSLALHPHAVFSPLGATAGVALLRRLDPAVLLGALNAAMTLGQLGPFRHAVDGDLIRNVWPAVGAWTGIYAPSWAVAGVTGGADACFDVLVGALGAVAHPERLTDGLGTSWAVLEGYHKLYACCQYAHAAVEAAADVYSRRSGLASEVADVLVETHPLALGLDNAIPATSLAAKFSLPHIVATALCTGDAAPASFEAAALDQPDVATVRALVRMEAFDPPLDPPHDRPARVTVRMADGTVLSSECLSARGGPDRPLGENELLEKVETLTGAVHPAMVDTVRALLNIPATAERPWSEVVRRMVT